MAASSELPESIRHLIVARYPFFFHTSPTRDQVAKRLAYVLQVFEGVTGMFEVSFTKLEDCISARLSWTQTPRLTFVDTGKDVPEAMFKVTLKAMDHPSFSPMFKRTVDGQAAPTIKVAPPFPAKFTAALNP
jgi:hypothetical protein